MIAATRAARAAARRTGARRILKAIHAIWYRETVRFVRDRGRWLGMLTQPLLYLLLVGYGIASSMSFRQAPAGVHVDYVAFMYPGILGMAVLFTSIFSGVGIIWDREFGFLKEVLVAPVPRWAAAAGKALGIANVVLFQTAALLLLAPLAHVPVSPLMVVETLAIAALIGVALGSVGIAIASRMQTLEAFQFVMNVLTLPMFFLSGALYPLQGLPPWLAVLSHLDPLTYGVDALRGAIYGASFPAAVLVQRPLGVNLLVLGGAAVVLAALAAWSFERQT
jgi:ABC-2 type transport system permease protein